MILVISYQPISSPSDLYKETTMAEPNCLPMCSSCGRPTPESKPFRLCRDCNLRSYCNKKCQNFDWKMGKHKKCCQKGGYVNCTTHQPWCVYLNQDPKIDKACLVTTGNVNTNVRELVTTGMNTCIFVVIKTKTQMIGWHASADSPARPAQDLFRLVREEDFVSGYIIPGEDRIEGSLNLKPTCRTMQAMPWTDPTKSRTRIFSVLREFVWFDKLEILAPVKSYKDFVVFDMVHRRPFTYSNTELFDGGCTFDGNHD